MSTRRQINGLAYSGGVATKYGRRIVIDLASARFDDPMPMLFQHDPARVIGQVRASNSGRAVNVAGDVYAALGDADADRVIAKADQGHKWQMSVGVFDFSEEVIPAGRSVQANGQTFTGPLALLTRAHIREASIVAIGADGATGAAFLGLSAGAGRRMNLEGGLCVFAPSAGEDDGLVAAVQARNQWFADRDARAAEQDRKLHQARLKFGRTF